MDENVRVIVLQSANPEFFIARSGLGRAILGQPEVAIGLVPGGGSTQRLPLLIGRGRALEVLLGCDDIPADVAELYGYINRALPPGELTPFDEVPDESPRPAVRLNGDRNPPWPSRSKNLLDWTVGAFWVAVTSSRTRTLRIAGRNVTFVTHAAEGGRRTGALPSRALYPAWELTAYRVGGTA